MISELTRQVQQLTHDKAIQSQQLEAASAPQEIPELVELKAAMAEKTGECEALLDDIQVRRVG